MKKYILFLGILFTFLYFYLRSRVYVDSSLGHSVAVTQLLGRGYRICEDGSSLKRSPAPLLTNNHLKLLSDSLTFPTIPMIVTPEMVSYQYSFIGAKEPIHVFKLMLSNADPLLIKQWKQKQLINDFFYSDTCKSLYFLLDAQLIKFPFSSKGWVIPQPQCFQ